MSDEPPKSIWQGSFHLYGVEMKCHVLDNGQRIIEADSIEKLFQAMGSPGALLDEREMQEFAKWQRSG